MNGRQAAGLWRTVRAGVAHHQAGRLDKAEALYRKALAKDPDHADALHHLGVIAYQCGKIGVAIQLIERAVPALTELPEVHLNLANVLGRAGKPAEAVESYRRAIALKPDYGMAHSNLARVLNDQGLFEAGLESASRAIELIPDFLGAQVNCAAALIGLERFAEAEAPLRRALALQPGSGRLHSDLGSVLTNLHRFDEALSCHERATALNPNDPAVHCALGASLYHAGDLTGSEASYRRSLSLALGYARAWFGLGNVLRTAGDFEQARSCFRRALELDPDFAEAHRCLAVTGQHTCNESELHRLRASFAGSERPVADRIAAGFALGTLLDNADRYDEAFPYFAEANALYRQQRADAGERFNPEALRHDVDLLIERCTPSLFSAMASWGDPSEMPVFVVGMPRSGTSLIEQILASHSRVVGAGELREMGLIVETLVAQNGDKPVAAWDAAFARELADRHVAHLQTLSSGAARVIDKMPDNVFLLWLIAGLLPSARVILCQRDPRDTCLSCFFQRFTEGHPYAYDLVDCALKALEVDRLATHWLRVLPLEMMVMDYEELVEDPEGESRRLIEFLGLDWEPACLDFHRTQRSVFTASAWQVRQPLFTRSVGRWRHYERYLGPLLEVLTESGVRLEREPS